MCVPLAAGICECGFGLGDSGHRGLLRVAVALDDISVLFHSGVDLALEGLRGECEYAELLVRDALLQRKGMCHFLYLTQLMFCC